MLDLHYHIPVSGWDSSSAIYTGPYRPVSLQSHTLTLLSTSIFAFSSFFRILFRFCVLRHVLPVSVAADVKERLHHSPDLTSPHLISTKVDRLCLSSS